MTTSMRDFADKSYLKSRDASHDETPVQKVGACIGLGIFIVAMGLMLIAGPELQATLQSVVQ